MLFLVPMSRAREVQNKEKKKKNGNRSLSHALGKLHFLQSGHWGLEVW